MTWQAARQARSEARVELARKESALAHSAELKLALEHAEAARSAAEQQSDIARRRLYALQISQADRALRNLEIGRAKELLSRCDSGLLGWEWQWLSKLGDRSTRSATLPVKLGNVQDLYVHCDTDHRRFANALS